MSGDSCAAPQGVAWWTDGRHLPEYQRARFPAGYFNLGVAHGIAGVIPWLARANAQFPSACKEALLEGAVDFLIAHSRCLESAAMPGAVAPNVEPHPGLGLHGAMAILALLSRSCRLRGSLETTGGRPKLGALVGWPQAETRMRRGSSMPVFVMASPE